MTSVTTRTRATVGVDPAAMALAVDPTVLRCFNLVTLAPQVVPWGLMVLAPRWRVTRAIVTPWVVPLLACAAHATVDGVGFATPGALEQAAAFGRVFDPSIPVGDWASAEVTGPFEAFNEMLQNPNFVGEEWTHVLTWDLFVGRFVYLDALARDVPFLRACLLLINFTGPPGLLAYALACVVSGKGLPPPPTSSSTLAVSVPGAVAADSTRTATECARGAFMDGSGKAADVIRYCAEDVVWDDISLVSGEAVRGRNEVFAKLTSEDAKDASCGGRIVVERVADGTRMAGFTFHRTNDANERGVRGTMCVELNDQGLISKVTVATEPLMKPGDATAKLLKAVAKPPENAAPKVLASRTPAGASDIVKYLWLEVQGCDDFKGEALRYFTDDILYEDVNFDVPFVGQSQVKNFLEEFDIPGLKFNPLSISDGQDACCFTWEVDLNMDASSTKVRGVSFYQADSSGKIRYIRDIPGSASTPVLGKLALAMNPALRTFSPTPTESELVAAAGANK